MTIPKRDGAELDRLLERLIEDAPHDVSREDTWLFVYGSMLKDPPFEAAERRVAVLRGFRRSFCLADPMLRGTEACPGLTLGLEPGDRCVGLAWRLRHEHARGDIAAFWPGEMQLPLYNAAWRTAALEAGGDVPALVLLADPSGPLFEPGLPQQQIVRRIARCFGSKGSNADYLFEAAQGLEQAGITDSALEDLAAAVRAAVAAE